MFDFNYISGETLVSIVHLQFEFTKLLHQFITIRQPSGKKDYKKQKAVSNNLSDIHFQKIVDEMRTSERQKVISLVWKRFIDSSLLTIKYWTSWKLQVIYAGHSYFQKWYTIFNNLINKQNLHTVSFFIENDQRHLC